MQKLDKKTGSLRHRLLASTILASAFEFAVASGNGPALAQAQGGVQQLQPLTVESESPGGGYKTDAASSPKQTAPLLDTPQTVTVIPKAVIEEQGARNLTEVLRNTPGISFNAGENGFATSTNNFQLRGFDSSANIFVDSSRDSNAYSRDMFNVDRVEVFKGAAADNGRGGPGGYVNLVTKTPTLQNFIAGDVGYGFDAYDSDGRWRGTADVNQAIGNGMALRLNVLLEEGGMPGREIAERNSWGVAPSLAFGLGTPFRATVGYEHVRQDNIPDWGVPGATIEHTNRFDPTTSGASRDAFYGLRSDFDDTVSDAVLARFEYDITGRMTVSNQTRWAEVSRDSRLTIPTGYVPAGNQVTTQTQFYSRETNTLTNLTNLSVRFDTGSFSHNVAAGLELTREKSDADRFGTFNAGNTNLFNPDPDRRPPFPMTPTEQSKVTVDTVALYAYDTVQFSPQWEVTGGIRAEGYRAEIESKTVAGAPNGTLDGFEESDVTLGGKVGVVYKPVQTGSIYAAFSTSTLPPGSYLSNPDISRAGDNAFPGFVQGADPVRSYNYEIGTKWNVFGDRLSTTAALFRTEKTNVPITGLDPGETVATLKGYGKQIVQGIELGVSGKVTDAWSIFGGVALMDSERKHSAYLDEVRKRADPGDYGTYTSTDGDELSFTPQFTGNLWTTYRLPVGLTLGGGLQYVGSSYLGRPDDANRIIPNDMFGKLPAYIVFNAMASYELTENVDLRLNVYNIADDKHAVATNWNGTRATLGVPRSFLVSTNFRF